MSNRSVRDGVILVGGFHFFMGVLCIVAVAAVFVFAVLPPISEKSSGLTQQLFLPVLGIVLGIIISIAYAAIGTGLIQFKNSARMLAIFMGVLGVFGGFVGVIGSIIANIVGQTAPDWVSIVLVGLASICFYALISFMNVFILIFLFNPRVRSIFYGEEWVANATDNDGPNELSTRTGKSSRRLLHGQDEGKSSSSLSDSDN